MAFRDLPSATPRITKSTFIIIVLAIGLAGALLIIVYQRYFANRLSQPVATTSQQSKQAYTSGLASFLASIKNADAATKRAHQTFYQYLSTLDESNFPSAQELRQFVEANEIPRDYLYFFKECLPSYGRSFKSASPDFNDPHILVSLPKHSKYNAAIFLNSDNLPVEAAYNAVNPQGSSNRIIVSGAYTSPTRLPAGLTIEKGRVINPAIQDFDGLLEIWPDGQLQITHVDAVQDGLKSLRIRTSFSDYMKFMKLAEQEGLTVLQSNLLIGNGDVLVKDDPLLKKLQRRVLFQTADDSVHIYDSLDKEQTLFETARFIKDHFGAQRAINLETGSFSFCTVNRQNKLTNRSNAKAGTIISNFLVIDF